jgi:hypothetical protein
VVELVGAHIGQRGVPLVVEQPGFLVERVVGPADVQATRRHLEVSGMTMFTRPGSISAVALDSTISWIVFMPTQTPLKRLSAKACRPRSRIVLHASRVEHRHAGRP